VQGALVKRGRRRVVGPVPGQQAKRRKGSAVVVPRRVPQRARPELGGPGVRVLSCVQVGSMLGVRPRNVVEFIKRRGLVGFSLGRKLGWRVLEPDLWAWIERQRQRGVA